MNKLVLLLLFFAGMANAQIINFPDPVFKAKLLEADVTNSIASSFFGQAKIDTNNNGEIEVSEAVEIYSLQLNSSGISDLTGISEFTSLQTLFCESNQLTSLDASNLSSLIVLVCANNQLTSLNINGMFNLEALECSGNQLTSLPISGAGLSSLRGLSCSTNQLTSLNLSGVTTLENLSCATNQLTSLNVSGLVNLKSINCGENQLTTFSVASLSNLEILWCYNNQLTNLNLTGAMLSLHEINCSSNQLTALNIPTLVNLAILRCTNNQLTTVNTTNLVNLKEYYCDNNLMPALNVSGLPLLQGLSCSFNLLTSLTLGNLNLKGLGCNNNLLTTVNFAAAPNLENLNFSFNTFPTADLTMLPNLKEASCYNNQLTSINVSGLVNLEQLLCMNNLLPTLDLSGLTALKTAWCHENQLTSLNVVGLTNLGQLSCSNNQLPTLDLTGLVSLWDFDCSHNLLPVLDVSGSPAIIAMNCSYNLLTELEVSNLSVIKTLNCGANLLTSLNVSGLVSMLNLYCDSNQIPALDLTGFVNLMGLTCSANLLTTLDISDSPNFVENFGVNCSNNLLTSIYAKNGSNEYIAFSGNPGLQFICADESQIADLQISAAFNNPSTVITSYCSFTPGGNYNSVTGTARIDFNGDGCDDQDISATNVRFDLTDGTMSSGTFANTLANYTLYAGIGDYTLTSHLENPSYYNVSPPSATFSFPALDSSDQIQNFCLTPNGIHPDLEVVLSSIGNARPGFDANYQVIYRNKGNQTMSGTVNITFDDFRSDFVSSTPAANNQTANLLTYTYSNLQPFEARVINYTLNINSSGETPPVDSGDIFEFTAAIEPIALDETESDNIVEFKQLVTNAMDPNVKRCMEGDMVSPENIGGYLHYNIEFENLGTSEATNVVVKDIIDTTMFDVNSLQVIYSSHNMRTSISGNKVEFIFQNINLAPAAGDPPVGGHGNVLFKIKSLSTLAVGAHVENKADIFFDYNAPIATEMARTTFQVLSTPAFDEDKNVSVYPNPSNGIVNIKSASAIRSIELYDIQGRLLQSSLETRNNATLDISSRSKGVYFLKIKTDNGSKVEKLLKQ